MELNKLFSTMQFPKFINPIHDITHLTNDSREAHNHALFIAYTGFEIDIHQYIPAAYHNGCRIFVIDHTQYDYFHHRYHDALFISSNNLKKDNAQIILKFYDYPDKKLTIIGITGTNGKTTIAELINQSIQKMGHKTAFFGTIKWSIGTDNVPVLNTTPDLIILVKFLQKAVQQNIKYVIMEVASHALSMGRVEDLAFDIAGFTNLTQDHLDYHHHLENYFQAKVLLFTEFLAQSPKQSKKAFLNIDDPYGQRLAMILEEYAIPYETLSLEGQGDWNAENITLSTECTQFDLNDKSISTALLGKINVQNVSMAYAILRFLGFDSQKIIHSIRDITIIGRLQKVFSPKGVIFLIDYAHTPDALKKVIEVANSMLKPNAHSIIVFGAGGDRDSTKRPLMAQACLNADIIIVTSDNPRTEEPQKIIDDIMHGFPPDKKNIYQEVDRILAIKLSYHIAQKDDIVIIAGKGHEDYQIIGKDKIHFSDIEQVQKLSKLRILDENSDYSR